MGHTTITFLVLAAVVAVFILDRFQTSGDCLCVIGLASQAEA